MNHKKRYKPEFIEEMENIKKQKPIRISKYKDLYEEDEVLEEEEGKSWILVNY